jgi:hypothetical protein
MNSAFFDFNPIRFSMIRALVKVVGNFCTFVLKRFEGEEREKKYP